MTDTKLDLARLRELHEAATPGPWGSDSDCDVFTRAIVDPEHEGMFLGVCSTPYSAEGIDARLIAAMRNALPALLAAAAEREDLRAEVERLRKVFRARVGDPDAKCTRCYGSGYVNEDGMDWPCPDCKSGGGNG